MIGINPSEITPEHIYLSRRKFMVGIGALATSSLVLSACGEALSPLEGQQEPSTTPPPTPAVNVDELGDPLTSFQAITNYTNYYEFTTSKEGVARLAQDFQTSPWAAEVGGLVHKPKTFDLDDLLQFSQEEKSGSIACAVWKPGPWSSPGLDSRWPSCSKRLG